MFCVSDGSGILLCNGMEQKIERTARRRGPGVQFTTHVQTPARHKSNDFILSVIFFTKQLRGWDLVLYLHPFYKQINTIIVMYAIVEIAGQQFKVSKDLKVYVHRLADKEGSKITFDKVLLTDDNGSITLGAPAIDGASVEATVLSHLKGDKV